MTGWKPGLCTFIVKASWRTVLQAILPGGIASSKYDSFSGKMFLKRLCIGNTGKVSTVHICCLGLGKTEL